MTKGVILHSLERMSSSRLKPLLNVGRSLAVATVILPMVAGQHAAQAQEDIRHYGRRMEAMFVRMDSNGDGRLVPSEVQGQPFLERKLRRPGSRGFLLIEDLHSRSRHYSGPRLQQHFQLADRNGDGLLNRKEAEQLPWVARHFNGLDLNGDGLISLRELWALQKALSPRMRP